MMDRARALYKESMFAKIMHMTVMQWHCANSFFLKLENKTPSEDYLFSSSLVITSFIKFQINASQECIKTKAEMLLQ